MTSDSKAASPQVFRLISKVWNLALWSLQILAAAVFLVTGANKFDPGGPFWTALFGKAGAHFWIDLFARIGFGQWFRFFTGGLEVICAILLLVPRASALAAALLACTMVGAILAHIYILGDNPAILYFLTLLLFIIAWNRRAGLAGWKLSFRKIQSGNS